MSRQDCLRTKERLHNGIFHFHYGRRVLITRKRTTNVYTRYMKRVERDPESLNRPEWNGLERNYELHDIGEAFVRRHLEHIDLEPVAWGIDMREEDEDLIFDDRMDLKVHEDHDLVGLTEIKTKRREDWYGVINRRHFRHYLEQVHHHEVPGFIYMSLVDEEAEMIERDTFIEIEPWEEFTKVLNGEYEYYEERGADQFLRDQVDRHPQITRSFRAPDGNQVVKLDLETGIDWPEFSYRMKNE